MKRTFYLFTLLMVPFATVMAKPAAGFVTKAEYRRTRPCACPGDLNDNGQACGQNTAYCRGGGENISDCFEPITTVDELIEQRREHCTP